MSEPTAKIRGGTRTNLSAPVPALAPDGGRNDDLKQTPGDGGSGAARYGCAAELRDRAAAEAETAEAAPARRVTRKLPTRERAAVGTSSRYVTTDKDPARIRYERSLMPKTSSASAGGRPQRSASGEGGSEEGRPRAARPTSRQSGGSWQRRRRWNSAKRRKRRTRNEDAAMIRPYSSSHDPWLPSPRREIRTEDETFRTMMTRGVLSKRNISEERKAEARTMRRSPAGEGRFKRTKGSTTETI